MATQRPGEVIGFKPYPHDVRIEREKHVFYVRGVRRWEPLSRGFDSPDLNPAAIAFGLVGKGAARVLRPRSDGWKVGILRYRSHSVRGWLRVIHREQLRTVTDPTARIAELVDDIEAGRFDS